MAKSKKLTDPSLKILHQPLAQTLSIHSSASDTIKTKFPNLVLADLLKYNEPKAQKQALKNITSSLQELIKDEACASSLTTLLIACYLDFGLASLKLQLVSILSLLPCTDFLTHSDRRTSLLFNNEIPLTHIEYLFSRYLELMQKFGIEIPRNERSRILAFVVTKVEAARQQHIQDTVYNVGSMNSMTTCMTFLSTFIPKWIPEMDECDHGPLKMLAEGSRELAKEQLLDRDILTLSGINYWIITNTIIRKQIGDYPAETELGYLSTMLSKGKLNLDDIKIEELVNKLDKIEKTPNVLCIIRGFLRVLKSLENLYKPCINDKSSYVDYILQCCEIDQPNTKVYGLITLNVILTKEAEIIESTRGETWAKQILSVVLNCLDCPHKGAVKATEDCIKSLFTVLNRRSLKIVDIALPLVSAIPDSFRKRKLLGLTPLIDFSSFEDLKRLKCYIKYSLECILEDSAMIRMASLCISSILNKLKKISVDTETWMSDWCDNFIITLCSSGDRITILSNSMVSIVLDIDHNALPLLVSRVLKMISESGKTELLVVLLALLVEARRLRKLRYEDMRLIVSDEVMIEFSEEFINALFNLADGNVTLLALTLCISNPKISELPEPLDRIMFAKAIEVPSTNTYDDYKEKHMKLCQKYLIDLKGKYYQTFTKDSENKEKAMNELKDDLKKIVDITASKLRIDSGYEMIFLPLSILRTLWNSLGEEATKWKLYSHSLSLFAVNGLSTTWDLQRTGAYSLLEGYPVEVLTMKEWNEFGKCGLKGLCSPRSTEAEGAALFLKLLYTKLLRVEGFELEWDNKSKDYAITLPPETELIRKQLRWIKIIVQRIKSKHEKVNETLFKKASCEDLYHGELRFLNLTLQCMKIEQSETSSKEWKALVDEILKLLQEISDYCEGLLSSAGIIDEETGNIIIDCRGRLSQMSPEIKAEITKAKDTVQEDFYYANDYENLLSTGIWLVAKESGNLYKMLADWLVLPGFNQSSWLTPEELKTIATNLLGKILSYKHRGAFLKLVEALQVLMSKCLRSRSKDLQTLPGLILDHTFKQIQEGSLETNKTLRRSAGVPHSILAVLRSEAYPILLGKTVSWLLERTKPSKSAEVRVHSLNILKLIFEDAEIRQDIQPFVYEVLMVATEGLSDPQWKVRNSSLMMFTAATKRIFGASSTLEQHLNKQGKTMYEFFGQSESLCKFMLQKLKENGPRNDPNSKFAIFPILLLFSRLVPSSQTKDITHVIQHAPQFKSEIIKLLGHADIGIRKISSKALLSLIDPDSYFNESITCLTAINLIGAANARLKPNLVHGLLEFILQLLKLHFKKSIAGESYNPLVKALTQVSFILEWEQSSIQAAFYKILNKLITKKLSKDSIELFKELAIKVCISNILINHMQGFANSIREQITFINRFDAMYETKSFVNTVKIIDDFINKKEWANVAWTYRGVCKVVDKFAIQAESIPYLKHISQFAGKDLDATKYCLKFIMRQAEYAEFIEVKKLWILLKDLTSLYKGVKQMDKLMLTLACRLGKQSLLHDTSQWLNEDTKKLLDETLKTLYESQYNEDMHPIRVTAAVEFTNLMSLLNPETIIKSKFNRDIIVFHGLALRIVIQLLHSDNAEIRSYTSRTIYHFLKTSIQIIAKDYNKEMTIQVNDAEFNEAFTFGLLFDYIKEAVISNKDKCWTKQFVSVLWEMITNLYFLENERRNEGKNLVFIYEPLNGYLNNIELKLFALKRLVTIPDFKDHITILKGETSKLMVAEEAVNELYQTKHQPMGLVKLSYIKLIDKLIRSYIEDYVLTNNDSEKANVKKIFIALSDTQLLDRNIIEIFVKLII